MAEREGPMDTQEQLEDAFPIRLIEKMVDNFYTEVRADPILGPIFGERISDWPVHLGRMVKFWRAVLRSEPVFKPSDRGGPPQLHKQIPGLSREHYYRWLALFGHVVDSIYPEVEAQYAKDCATRIAYSLSRHLPSATGEVS